MKRRELLKIIGLGAVSVAAFDLPAQVEAFRPEYWRDGDAAFIVIDAPSDLQAGEIVFLDGRAAGVSMRDVRRGRRAVIQIYGNARINLLPLTGRS